MQKSKEKLDNEEAQAVCQLRRLYIYIYISKLSFGYEGKIKAFPDNTS